MLAVLPEPLDRPVLPERTETPVALEHLEIRDPMDKTPRLLALLPLLLLASHALLVLLDPPVLPDLLEMPDPTELLDLLDLMEPLESLDRRDRPDLTETPEHPDRLDPTETMPSPKEFSPEPLDPLDSQDLPDLLDPLEDLEEMELLVSPDPRDLTVLLETLEPMERLDDQESLERLALPVSVESAPSIALLTEASSSRTELAAKGDLASGYMHCHLYISASCPYGKSPNKRSRNKSIPDGKRLQGCFSSDFRSLSGAGKYGGMIFSQVADAWMTL